MYTRREKKRGRGQVGRSACEARVDVDKASRSEARQCLLGCDSWLAGGAPRGRAGAIDVEAGVCGKEGERRPRSKTARAAPGERRRPHAGVRRSPPPRPGDCRTRPGPPRPASRPPSSDRARAPAPLSLTHTPSRAAGGAIWGRRLPCGRRPEAAWNPLSPCRDRRPLLTSDLLSRRRTCPEPCSPEIARSRHTGAMAAHSRTRIWSPRACAGRTFLIANRHGYYSVVRASDLCPNTPPSFVGVHQPDRVNTPSTPISTTTHPGTHNASRDGG
jgi:hypothetical protein